MKVTTLATGLLFTAANALAAIVPVTLSVKSDNAAVNGMGLTSTHEGAGINYFFLDTQSQELLYDQDNKQLFMQLSSNNPEIRQSFLVSGNVVQLSVAGAATVTFDDNGLLKAEGVDPFYAAKNINDPYNYSNVRFALVSYPDGQAPDGAIAVQVVGKFTSAPSGNDTTTVTTSAKPTSTPVPTPTPVPGAAAQFGVGLAAVGAAAGLLL